MKRARLNFRNTTNFVDIKELTQCKDDIFHQRSIKDLLKKIKSIFINNPTEFKEPETQFTQYLQSLIYYILHLKKLHPDYVQEVLSDILNELSSCTKEHLGIWIDEKEGVNLFHAFARSDYDNTKELNIAYELFEKSLGELLQQKDKDGFTPLNSACKEGKISTIESLINKAKSILNREEYESLLKTPNEKGFTPFISLANPEFGHLAMPLFLEESETLDINQTNQEGCTALHIACHNGNLDTVQFLLKNNSCNPKLLDDVKNSALHHAAFAKINNGYLIEVLIPYFSSINSVNGEGNTPLNIACRNGNEKTVCILLDKGADLYTVNFEKVSPIYNTLRNKHISCFKPLLEGIVKEGKLLDVLTTPLNGYKDNFLYNVCFFNQIDFFKELIIHLKSMDSKELSQILCHKNSSDKTIFDACLSQNLGMLDTLLGLAAKKLDLETYKQYTYSIYSSDNKHALTILLYQSYTYLDKKGFTSFMSQKVTNADLTLHEKWKNEPDIISRINRYLKENTSYCQDNHHVLFKSASSSGPSNNTYMPNITN